MATSKQTVELSPLPCPDQPQASEPAQRERNSSDGRKKNRKYRYKRQGYHKVERENARIVEARNFLSGITLDSHYRAPVEAAEQDSSLHHTPSKHSGPGAQESKMELALPTDELANLYELYTQSQRRQHSPVKLPPTRSQDMGLEYSTQYPVNRSTSLFDAATTPGSEQRKPLLQYLGQTKSLGSSIEPGGIRYFGRDQKFPVDSRVVFIAGGAPFLVFSSIAYKKDESKLNLERPQHQRTRINSTSLQLDLDVELGTSEEVSLARLFKPTAQHKTEYIPTVFGASQSHQSDATKHSSFYGLGASYNDVLDQPLPSSCGPSFPWVDFRDHHSTHDVLLHYHPLCLDNYDFFVGTNISTLSLQSYMVSIIQYAKASQIKKDINEKFRDTFPHIKISLSKLRTIKKDMYNVAKEMDVDMGAVSHAYVYLEKLVLMGKVTKSNRQVVAGVCLFLAAKFFMDMKKSEIKDLLEEITDTFHISNEELVSYELPTLVALHFSLLTPIYQTFTHFERLRDRDISSI